jgi:hypothetical protein
LPNLGYSAGWMLKEREIFSATSVFSAQISPVGIEARRQLHR